MHSVIQDAARRRAEERALVEAVARGDADALATIYDRYSGMLLGLAQRVLGDRADAEDVLQETFAQVWRQAGRYDGSRSSLSTWLVLITRSRAIDRLRGTRLVRTTLSEVRQQARVAHASPEGQRDVLTSERRARLRAELSELPQAQREVIEMAFYRGMTQSEIAGETGVPLGTVKTRTLLAMRKLRAALREEIGELL